MPSVPTVRILEERWTSTTIKTAFVFQPPSRTPSSRSVSIDFPLLSLEWTLGLSLTPDKPHGLKTVRGRQVKRPISSKFCNWIPVAFSFQQHANTVRWGHTSFRAELSLEQESDGSFVVEGYHLTPLAVMNVILTDMPSSELLQVPLETSCTISSLQLNKVWLTVTISECPFPNGFFDARFGTVNEAQIQVQLVRQSGDRALNQSLTTGKLFDVKFLTSSTRPIPGGAGDALATYASLLVLEEHIDLSSSVLRESWANALAALDTGPNHVGDPEISCPKDCEYELDSDFEDEDEDEAPSPPCDFSGGERDLAVPEDRQSKNGFERSSSSLSPFESVEGVSDLGSVDNQLEELVKCPNEPQEPPSNRERVIRVGFAAHRTWRAFLWYCYTGKLEFGKLKSQVEPGDRHLRVMPLDGGPPTCSPKSMYRLADFVGNKELKAKALAAIKKRMTETNVLDEAFSVFTSKYPDVREVQLDVLVELCGSPHVKKAFLRAMGKYASMSHAEPVLSAFYDSLVG